MKVKSPMEKSYGTFDPRGSSQSPSSIRLSIKVRLDCQFGWDGFNSLRCKFFDVVEQKFGYYHSIIIFNFNKFVVHCQKNPLTSYPIVR